ncbi:uncharacterized protein LOC108099551 [Drosophila ficusphila]|uniref:uncharacterized protein LOC108099551 n=1 Tax=Drosophila ficusphila TaxID=30025 RepID=UPI0007E655A1|nr:uncharacterized protein LOC108099551 [Drosophila ficusphila]
MEETKITDLIDIRAPDLTFAQLKAVLKHLRPLQRYSFCVEACEERNVDKLYAGFLKMLIGNLSIEEVVALYSATIGMFLLEESEFETPSYRRLELLNAAFAFSDTLKPTMVHYATVEILESLKISSSDEEQHFIYLLETIPHIVVASDTGKMISLGLLRTIIAKLSGCQIILHIYRTLWEAWEMIKQVSQNAILLDWSLRRTFILFKAFAMLTATAALNSGNQELKQAGYRGFNMPPEVTEISDWFKTLRDRLEEKHKELKCREGLMLVRFVDQNILAYLTETGNESTSEVGNEANAEAGNETTL